jgi:hypothetical protein
MLSTLRNSILACALGLLLILFSASPVSAQETGTLIVYEEAQGGDASFSFSGSGSIGSFQIATEQGGGAKVFDLPVGTYTLAQTDLLSGWITQEIFCDGTGTPSTDASQSKATFTVSSAADVFYCRFTNLKSSTNPTSSPSASPIPSPSISENIALPLVLVLLVITTSIIALFTKKKKQINPAFAVLLSALMMFAFVGPVQANPDKFIQLGTSGNDEQTQFGTPNRDVIVQFGFGGNDTQYAEGNAGDDIIVQNGGSGQDELTIMTGSGNDFVVQEGGDGSDFMYIELGSGDFNVAQNGGNGNNIMQIQGGVGNGQITVKSGDGNDEITAKGNTEYDLIRIDSGSGDDNIDYTATGGVDSVRIDGGLGNDFLSISRNAQSFQLLDGSGAVLYSVGSGGSIITVVNVEHGQVLGNDLKVAFQW